MDPPELTITAFWNLSGPDADFWTVGDPVRGALDEYGIAGDIETDITQYVRPNIRILRGRNRQLDEIQTGTTTIRLKNQDRLFDPFNTVGEFYGNIVPGKKFVVRAGGVAIFTGRSIDFDYPTVRNEVPTAMVALEDSLSALAVADMNPWTPVGTSASEQINEALDRPEVGFGSNRNIEGGVSTLGPIPVETGTKVLPFAQKAARSDLGRFFADREDTVTFLDRHSSIGGGDSAVTLFADDDTGIPFTQAQIAYGVDALFTRTVVSRVGGSTEIADDPAAALLFGQISTGSTYTDLLLADDEQSADMADFLAGVYSDPEIRIASITVRTVACRSALEQTEVLSLDVGSLIQVTYTPEGVGDPIVRLCVVEGFEHDIKKFQEHDVTLFLGDVLQFGVWTVEDPVLGALDSSPIAF